MKGASIGEAVSEALEAAGIEVLCEAEKPTVESLTAAIERTLT